MNVLVIGAHGYTFSTAETDLCGSGWPPRECFAHAVVIDLRPLGARRAELVAMRLPLADPQLPAGHARSPWRGVYRWQPGTECAIGAVAPDVLATLACTMGARVLHQLS